jgi:predicted dehydrogenase
MNRETNTASRREFLTNAGRVAAAGALVGVAIPRVYAAENNTIRVALVGCGGRGTGAAIEALSVGGGPMKLVAMADVFQDRLASSHTGVTQAAGDKVDVPRERQFLGFDAYRKALDCLRPGDVAILATPPAFRWVHFGYAIEKGVHSFLEKPISVDGPTTRKMLKLGEESVRKNLKVGVGLMSRHSPDRIELHERIRAGELGPVLAMRAYRMFGGGAYFLSPPKPEGISELLYQVQRFHSFLWASGGAFSDFYIHNIDECCWMKNAWPVAAQALGARQYRGNSIDQNFDVYAVEYTFDDGTKLFLDGRTMPGCHEEFASYVHGTKGLALVSIGHSIDRCRIYRGQKPDDSQIAWKFSHQPKNHYQVEWDDLIDAIRGDRPYNEVKRGAEASLVTAMGRMAAHTGQVVTYDQMLHCEHEFAPMVDTMTMDSPAPLLAGPDGKYPMPQPGIKTKREY